MRNYLKLLFYAFFFNFLWENLHAPLYLHYRGEEISELILARAAAIDALIIFFLIFISRAQKISKNRTMFIFFFGLAVAIILEKWALATGRWAYGPSMPIIPILNIGLTPAIQLGLLGVVCFKLVFDTKKPPSRAESVK